MKTFHQTVRFSTSQLLSLFLCYKLLANTVEPLHKGQAVLSFVEIVLFSVVFELLQWGWSPEECRGLSLSLLKVSFLFLTVY